MIIILSVIAGLVLGPIAMFFLISANDAHVAMCMLGAVLVSVAFIVNAIKPSEKIQKVASFAAGWIFFYTILTGTSYLIYEWFMGAGNFDPNSPLNSVQPVYIYHFLINFVVLLVFWLKFRKIKAFILGNIFALILSPLMLFFVKVLDWPSFMESNSVIGIYVALGLILLIFYSTYLKNKLKSEIVVHTIENFFVTLLWVYAVLSFALLVASIVKPEGILESENSEIKRKNQYKDQPYDYKL